MALHRSRDNEPLLSGRTSSFLLSPKRTDKRPTPHARRCCSGISHSPPLRTDKKRAGYATFTIDGPRPGRGGYSFQPAKRIPNQVIIGRCKYSVFVARNVHMCIYTYMGIYSFRRSYFFRFPKSCVKSGDLDQNFRAENFRA